MEATVGSVAALFAAMGIFALIWPARVLALVGTAELTLDGRNEVRAVYGGFGLAAASALVWGLISPRVSVGIFFTIGLLLWGMAAGRVISVLLERRAGFFPWVYLTVEVAAGGALIWASLRVD